MVDEPDVDTDDGGRDPAPWSPREWKPRTWEPGGASTWRPPAGGVARARSQEGADAAESPAAPAAPAEVRRAPAVAQTAATPPAESLAAQAVATPPDTGGPPPIWAPKPPDPFGSQPPLQLQPAPEPAPQPASAPRTAAPGALRGMVVLGLLVALAGAGVAVFMATSGIGQPDAGVIDLEPQTIGQREAGPRTVLDGSAWVAGDVPRSEMRNGYLVDLRAGQGLAVDAYGGVDTYLWVYGPDAVLLDSNDDGGRGTDARIRVVAADDGPHLIHVGAYSNNVGPYVVAVDVDGTLGDPPAEIVDRMNTIGARP